MNILRSIFPVVLAMSAQAFALPLTNVALHGVVVLDGAGFKKYQHAPSATLTDGIFLADKSVWNTTSTVGWSGLLVPDKITHLPTIDLLDSITINLAGNSLVSSINLQADTQDRYTIQYRDTKNEWVSLAMITTKNIGTAWPSGLGFGSATFATPVRTDAFRITGSGDNNYAVSEFQAFGVSSVPEPDSYAMLLAGLGLMGFMGRRSRTA